MHAEHAMPTAQAQAAALPAAMEKSAQSMNSAMTALPICVVTAIPTAPLLAPAPHVAMVLYAHNWRLVTMVMLMHAEHATLIAQAQEAAPLAAMDRPALN